MNTTITTDSPSHTLPGWLPDYPEDFAALDGLPLDDPAVTYLTGQTLRPEAIDRMRAAWLADGLPDAPFTDLIESEPRSLEALVRRLQEIAKENGRG